MSFELNHNPCGAPVFEMDMSAWDGAGCPDPITNLPCNPEKMQLYPICKDGEEVTYWVTASDVSGAFLRLFNR